MTDHTPDICEGQEAAIYRYLDGEMSRAEQDEWLAHTQTCRACQALLAETETFFADLAAMPSIDLAPETVSLAASDIMANFSTAQVDQPSRFDLVILLLQMVVGLGLLSLVLPQFFRQVRPFTSGLSDLAIQPAVIDAVSSWFALLNTAASSFWLTWSQSFRFAALDISTGWALVLIVGLALIWLFGNSLLLGRRPQMLKNGGTS